MLRAALIIIQIIVIIAMVRPHAAQDKRCVEYTYHQVQVFESKYIDIVWPWAQSCTKRYNPATGKAEPVK
jgi:hypothetical protein